jgi:outer membrane protein OmpA-like peptidoglycan-associated protein
MKYIVCLVVLCLSGCGALVTDRLFDDNMLDTAPKSDAEVMYPHWGNAPKDSNSGVKGPQGQVRPESAYLQLRDFLLKNQIDYEVLPGDFIIVRIKRTVHFNVGSTNFSYESQRWLMKIRRFLNTSHGVDVVVDGHTDDIGNAKYNDQLSKRRAEAVKDFLSSDRVSLDSIYARGYGDIAPVCTNQTRKGKACNRRVELFFILPSPSYRQ